MKRMWFGAAVLLALLILGILTARKMETDQLPIMRQLEQASRYALEDQWPQAEQSFENARAQWQRRWHLTAAVADHTPMEEVDSLFAQIQVYAQRRRTVSFAAGCAELARRIQAVADAHSMDWWNLL